MMNIASAPAPCGRMISQNMFAATPSRALCEYYRTLEISSAFVQTRIERDGRPTLPVLSVAGGAGRGRAGEAADSISRLVTNLDSHIIPGCGHLVPEEAADELCDLLLPFLNDSK